MKIAFIILSCFSIINSAQNISVAPEREQPFKNGFAGSQVKAPADSIPPDSTGMGILTSVELSRKMIPGWNLGNTMEATPNETSWGNPLTTQKFIDSIKAAGINSIRIPVAWSKFTDTLFTINQSWLDRVEEVANYALNNDMYVIINEHWDGGWQVPDYKDSAYVNRRLAAMWRQIALQFRDYDAHLLFAGTNEVHIPDNYSAPSKENSTVQNGFNQVFVNTVRSTGGRNYYRYLVVQGYNTNIDYTVSTFSAPADVVPVKQLVEVHYYDPYDFTLNGDDRITQWGMYATMPSKTENWANEAYADAQFKKMKNKFVDNGFGVVLGEYGATIRSNLGSPELNAEYAKYRLYYTQYITRSMERNGLVPYYWDIGSYGNHGSGIFNRSTGVTVDRDILKAVTDTSKVDPVSGIEENSLPPEGYYLEQNYPNPFNPGTKIKYSIGSRQFTTLKVYDILGKEVAVLVNEEKEQGSYEVNFSAAGLASGVYYYTLKSGNVSATKKLMFIK